MKKPTAYCDECGKPCRFEQIQMTPTGKIVCRSCWSILMSPPAPKPPKEEA